MKNLFLLLLLACVAGAAQKPNVILIVVDDMGRDWVSCYGAKHPTTNVDRLAKEGVRYETAWCTPICTPTRVTLLTGQYPFRHGWTKHYDVPRQGGAGLRPDRFTTFARVLRDNGYSTVIGGKWQVNHLGKQPNILREHGFDEHCVWPGAEAGKPETEPRYWKGFLQANDKRGTAAYGPDSINEYLIDFIQRHKDRPFLVYYPMLLTHGPYAVTPFNREKKPERKTALYAGNVTYMDHLVGRLVTAVDKLGLKDKTMIVFTGDNGSAASGTLNGEVYPKGKGGEADCGVHMPFIVRAPFLSKGNVVSRDLIDFTDLYPTLLDLAGIAPPEDLKLDGKSFLPSLRGSEDPYEKRSWVYSQIGEFRMIRDWYHIVDNKGSFHNLSKDPRQERPVSKLDKIAPGRRQRLQMILDRFPEDAPAPFAELGSKQEK
jgi:arylsulfatase A-like enzyme